MLYIFSEVVTHVSQVPAGSDSALPRSVGVGWGYQLVVPGSILPKPWMMSCLVKMMCSFTLSLRSRTLFAKGQKSGSTGGLSLSAQYCNPQDKPQLREKAAVTCPDRTSGRNTFQVRHYGAECVVYPWPRKTLLLTVGIKKEAQIFWAGFLGSSTPWNGSEFHPPARHIQFRAHQSSQDATSLIEGSEG